MHIWKGQGLPAGEGQIRDGKIYVYLDINNIRTFDFNPWQQKGS